MDLKLLVAFIAWVIVLFLEFMWLLNDVSSGGRNKEVIYSLIIISLVVGVTGLNGFT